MRQAADKPPAHGRREVGCEADEDVAQREGEHERDEQGLSWDSGQQPRGRNHGDHDDGGIGCRKVAGHRFGDVQAFAYLREQAGGHEFGGDGRERDGGKDQHRGQREAFGRRQGQGG